MFLILVEKVSYSLSSFSVRFTFIGITTGFASLLSSTAFLMEYLFTGGSTAKIVLFLKSDSSKVAVSPNIAFLGSSTTVSNILLNDLADS